MNIYIRSAACISAQKTFDNDVFLGDIVEYTGTRLRAIEPDYKEFIDPKQIRRMSHIIKMGIAAAKRCLSNGKTTMPGAVITGTAFGCMEDTVSFLTRIVEENEELLSPTAFIQSTHNTVGAQIALLLKCHNYNNTFVHKGISFESALLDATLLLREQEADNILVGAIDEMIDTSFTVLTRLGLYRRQPVSNLSLFTGESKGTIGGEGTAFFMLTDKPSTENLAELTALSTLYKPVDIERSIKIFLESNSLTIDDIDLVFSGKNGDFTNDKGYHTLGNSLFKNTALANYKHLCGDYSVSSSFAFWLAANILKRGFIPDAVIERKTGAIVPKKILIYNHYQNKYHALMLLSAV